MTLTWWERHWKLVQWAYFIAAILTVGIPFGMMVYLLLDYLAIRGYC